MAEVKDKESKKSKPGLDAVLAKLQKSYGTDNVKYGDWKLRGLDVIPTGAVTLDRATGVGGVPRGRLTVIYGHESSGKTTLATHIIANAQKLGLKCVLIDAEHSFDISYAQNIGVNKEELIFIQPDSGDQAFAMLESLVDTGEIGLVVVDSIAGLVPAKELETGVAEMGGIARLMSSSLRRIAPSVRKNNVALVLINQIRMKIGVMYGSPETQPGGKAHMFAASVIIKVNKSGVVGDGDTSTRIHTKARVTKNKVAPPLREAEFDIVFGRGIDNFSCIVDVAAESGVIQKQSSYYMLRDKKYNGRDKAIEALKADPALFDEIYKQVMGSDLPQPKLDGQNDDLTSEEQPDGTTADA